MTKTFEELTQAHDAAEKIENPWERAVRMQMVDIESRIVYDEREIDAHLKSIKEYAAQYLSNEVEHYEPHLAAHKRMVQQQDQLKDKLRTLEHIAERASK
ncbi:hypothetical protein FACS1894184_17990 [Clostridia bacterium]|nr:hypothetical protein FACS1894184_17990 [Clostridia bacterium]